MIIAGFPGVGKSTLVKNYPQIFIDLDSSLFNKLADGTRNPHFFADYAKAILAITDKHVLVSTHPGLLQALSASLVDFTVVMPDIHLRDEYMVAYKSRGNDDEFITNIYKNWDTWIQALKDSNYKKIVLQKGEYLIDCIDFDKEFNPLAIKFRQMLSKF